MSAPLPLILRGDARNLPIADASVDLIVTSPPYFGQRSYQDGGEHYQGQIGDESSPYEFLDALIEATAEMVRVLKPAGSIWVNLGDKYANDAKWGGSTGGKHVPALHGQAGPGRGKRATGLPAKSLMGIPWRYAIRCIDELGLSLRAEVIWHKVNVAARAVEERRRAAVGDGWSQDPRLAAPRSPVAGTAGPGAGVAASPWWDGLQRGGAA